MPDMTGRPGCRTMEMFGRKYRVVPRAYPLHPLICAYFHRVGNKERFRLPGVGREHFHCTVDPSPGHIRCRKLTGYFAIRKSTTSITLKNFKFHHHELLGLLLHKDFFRERPRGVENSGGWKTLGRPVCRTKLPRKALISKRKMVRKTPRNFPEKF